MCIKFCGAFELALRWPDKKSISVNPGIYLGLINFAVKLIESYLKILDYFLYGTCDIHFLQIS